MIMVRFYFPTYTLNWVQAERERLWECARPFPRPLKMGKGRQRQTIPVLCSCVEEKKLHSFGEVGTLWTKKQYYGIAASLGYSLKPEQKRSIWKFLSGNDMFISLPAEFGISLCYIMLPLCFDARKGVKNKSMILVFSPLKALMVDQVSAIRRLMLSAVCVTDKECATNLFLCIVYRYVSLRFSIT